MSFIKKKKTETILLSKEECLQHIKSVIDAGKLTDEQLNRLVKLMEDDNALKRALIFL